MARPKSAASNAPSARPARKRWRIPARIAAASFCRDRGGHSIFRNCPMSDYQTSEPFRVRQAPKRAAYDRETVHAILDAGYVAHVAFATEAGPVALPMFYVRDGESVLVHGSRKSRFMRLLSAGQPVCLTVTHMDGLVLARSAFHHSMNYRSVMAHGVPAMVTEAEKPRALDLFTRR